MSGTGQIAEIGLQCVDDRHPAPTWHRDVQLVNEAGNRSMSAVTMRLAPAAPGVASTPDLAGDQTDVI